MPTLPRRPVCTRRPHLGTGRLSDGDCPHFKEIKVVRAAYGFKLLFKEVKQKDLDALRGKVVKYLGSYRTYYRYNSGERKLTPEQQEYISGLFRQFGYSDELQFEHYQDIISFT